MATQVQQGGKPKWHEEVEQRVRGRKDLAELVADSFRAAAFYDASTTVRSRDPNKVKDRAELQAEEISRKIAVGRDAKDAKGKFTFPLQDYKDVLDLLLSKAYFGTKGALGAFRSWERPKYNQRLKRYEWPRHRFALAYIRLREEVGLTDLIWPKEEHVRKVLDRIAKSTDGETEPATVPAIDPEKMSTEDIWAAIDARTEQVREVKREERAERKERSDRRILEDWLRQRENFRAKQQDQEKGLGETAQAELSREILEGAEDVGEDDSDPIAEQREKLETELQAAKVKRTEASLARDMATDAGDDEALVVAAKAFREADAEVKRLEAELKALEEASKTKAEAGREHIEPMFPHTAEDRVDGPTSVGEATPVTIGEAVAAQERQKLEARLDELYRLATDNDRRIEQLEGTLETLRGLGMSTAELEAKIAAMRAESDGFVAEAEEISRKLNPQESDAETTEVVEAAGPVTVSEPTASAVDAELENALKAARELMSRAMAAGQMVVVKKLATAVKAGDATQIQTTVMEVAVEHSDLLPE